MAVILATEEATKRQVERDLSCSLMVEHLPNAPKVLGSTLSTEGEKKARPLDSIMGV